jgi:phytol kinase
MHEYFATYEFRRKAFHVSMGLLFVFLISVIPRLVYVLGLLFILIIGLILSIYTKYKKPRYVLYLLQFFDKPKDLIKFPGKGAIYYLVGTLIAVGLFDDNIAAASLLILAVGDPAAQFFGKYYGKYKLSINARKVLEGTLAGMLFGTIAAAFYVPLYAAFFGAMCGMIAEALDMEGFNLDDNISIPITSGVVMTAILTLL